MKKIDLLISARWVIPVEPDNSVLENHTVAIHDRHIIDILPTVDAPQKYFALKHHNLTQHALIPGLVNAHTHTAMNLMRGLADDLPLNEWLKSHIWPTEARWVNAEFVRDGTRLAIAEMLRSGTTCFNDMYFFPEVTAHVASSLGMRANIGMIVIDFPTVWAQHADEYIARGIREVLDVYKNDDLINVSFAPHAPYTVSDAPLKKIRNLADELEKSVHIHVHETPNEIESHLARYGVRPLERLEELGLVGPQLIAVHMTQIENHEIELLAKRGVNVVHCPQSNLKLASGFSPVTQLIESGINVALGTDGAASNNDLDLWDEMRTAALLAKGVAGRADAVPAHTALRMATLNGAKALGQENKIGSIVPGKAADLVAVDLGRIETQPVYDPISQLIYAAGRESVSHVWIAGKTQLLDGQLVQIDTRDLILNAASWGLSLGTPPQEDSKSDIS